MGGRRWTPRGEGRVSVDELDELQHLLFIQQDVISYRQALAHMSRGALRNLVDSGRWRKIHREVFLAHNGPASEEQRRWIASLAAGGGSPALLGGLSALEVLGLRNFRANAVHILLPASRQERNPPAGVIVHRTRLLPAADIYECGRPPCTMPARSLVDAATWARSDREACTIIAMAFQQRLVSLTDVDEVLSRLPRQRRRRLTIMTARDADGGAHSLAELDVATLLRKAKLPEPSRQVIRKDRQGRRRYLDLYFTEWHVHVEIDGAQHVDPRRAWSDMNRQKPTRRGRRDPRGPRGERMAGLIRRATRRGTPRQWDVLR